MINWRGLLLTLDNKESNSSVRILSKSTSDCVSPGVREVVLNLNSSRRLARVSEILHTVLDLLHQRVSFSLKLLGEEDNPLVKSGRIEERCDCSVKIRLSFEIDTLLVTDENFSRFQLSAVKSESLSVKGHLPLSHHFLALLVVHDVVKELSNSFELLLSVGKENLLHVSRVLSLQIVRDSCEHASLRNEIDLLLFTSSLIDVNQHWLIKILDVKAILLLVVVFVGDLSSLTLLIQSESLHRIHVIVDVLNSVDSLVVASHDTSMNKLLGDSLLDVRPTSRSHVPHAVEGS
jgi:hypothetical protein